MGSLGPKGRLALAFFLIFSSSALICGADWQIQSDPSDSLIMPPPLPDNGTSATYLLMLELRDYQTKALVNDTHALISISDNRSGETTQTIEYIGPSGQARIMLAAGHYDISLVVDQIDTAGKDYYYSFSKSIASNQTQTIYLFPVGSVVGSVVSSQGQMVVGAKVKLDCGSDYGQIEPLVSDEFGQFNAPLAPASDCRISAVSGSQTGYEDVSIRRGGRVVSKIMLNESVGANAPGTFGVPFSGEIAGFIIGGIIVVGLLFLFYKFEKQEHGAPKEGDKGQPAEFGQKLKKGDKNKPGESSFVPDAKATKKKESKSKHAQHGKSRIPVSSLSYHLSTHPFSASHAAIPANVHASSSLPAPAVSARAQDILKTLSENEKKVAEHLLSSGNNSTQARMRNSLGMPKTSLARVLQMLERKRVVEVERIGKLKKVRLTDWFLGRE